MVAMSDQRGFRVRQAGSPRLGGVAAALTAATP